MAARDITGDGFSEAITESSAPSGHNKPPVLLVGDELLRDLKERFEQIFKEAEETLASEKRAPHDGGEIICPNEHWEKRMSDMVRKIQGIVKELNGYREAELRPYRENADIVHSLFRDAMDKLASPDPKRDRVPRYKERLERALNGYKTKIAEEERKERERVAAEQRAREEAERKEREAAEAAARELQRQADEAAAAASRKRNEETKRQAEEAARLARIAAEEQQKILAAARAKEEAAAKERHKAEERAAATSADLTRTRGQASVSSQQEFVDFRDLDRNIVDLEALRQHLPSAAIEQAVNAYRKANTDTIKDELRNKRQPLRGVFFFINTKTSVR